MLSASVFRSRGNPKLRWLRSGAFVSIARGVSGACRERLETDPATGSDCKSHDYRRSHSGRILLPCGIGSPSTRCRPRWLLLHTKARHHKLGPMRSLNMLQPQWPRRQLSVARA